MVTRVLFVQGGGAGAHDEWDVRLVAGLRDALGDGYDVHYPVMPSEGEPGYAAWSAALRREIRDGDVVVGHSVGATILIQTLAETAAPVAMIVLVSAPFVGEGGWPGTEFSLDEDLGARLAAGVPVHVFQGLADETVPPEHADLYARAVPQARVHRLPGRDHQMNDDLREVAAVIRSGSS